jgi:hypothetical protein
MIRSKHAIAREIEETREDLATSAKMAAVSLLLRNPISLTVKTIAGFLRRRRARKDADRYERGAIKRRGSLYRNLGIALGSGIVAGFAYRYWRRSGA